MSDLETLSCKYYTQNVCRSCSWLQKTQSIQIQEKEAILRHSLAFLGDFQLLESSRSELQAFRNRTKWIVTGSIEKAIIGIAGKENLDEGSDLIDCPILHPKIIELTKALTPLIAKYKLTPYSIGNRTGELKGLIVFYSPLSEELYLRFVLRSTESVSRINKLVSSLQKQFSGLKSVSANIQPIPQAILEGEKEIFFSEQRFVTHVLPTDHGQIALKLSPRAFVQSNAECANKLYQRASEWIKVARPKRMLELYCGQGAFSFYSAPHAEEILGIELNTEAVSVANETAKEHGFNNMRFLAADASLVSKEIFKFAADLILVNPPRRGLAQSAIDILTAKPKDFIYSSCSHESLATDLKLFKENYTVVKAQIFDMFPHTAHFETLIWLRRNS
ncbi:23S rRNA (uracil(1939)-C(5))-methyltransferase RlmD [bacterium]|nr:23S rRNA (uracil(1939)-C(5))-methyltransferase RlmD [bacterium]